MSVKFEVLLRDRNGHEGVHEYDCEDENADSQVFMWEDGNYACDCNRSIFLYGYDIGQALPCSGTLIKVVWLKRDGMEVYKEI